MSNRALAAGLVLGLALAAPAASRAQPAAPPPDINAPFRDPDVQQYLKRFESESREVYARRGEIVAALGLKPGMAAADVGAGTGLFTILMAERVGPSGKVYAVDIAPKFLEYIASRAKEKGLGNVETVRGTQDATNLPPGSVDLVFMSDVYHHLEHPEAVLATIHRALKPGGRLVVVEFDRREGVSTDFVLKHVRAGQDVFAREIQAAGFAPVEVARPPALRENFFRMFRKEPTPEPAPARERP